MPPPIEYWPNGGEPYSGGGMLLWGLPPEATAPLLPLLPLGLMLKGDMLRDKRVGWDSISNNIVHTHTSHTVIRGFGRATVKH